jgi:hypothetical protein
MKNRLALSGVLALGFALSASPLWARVADISLKELVDGCDLIVVATVSKVEDAPGDLKLGEEVTVPVEIATARVLEVWKGNAPREVRYVASPTWTCDVSDAKVGERVVLFLKKPEGWPIRVIAHAGRGRMPIRDVNGKLYATIRADDVRLPTGVSTISDSESKYQFIRAVDLSLLRSTVKAMGRTDILIVGSVCTFAVAGLTWFFCSRRRHKKLAPLEEIRGADGTRTRDARFMTWLRAIAKRVLRAKAHDY